MQEREARKILRKQNDQWVQIKAKDIKPGDYLRMYEPDGSRVERLPETAPVKNCYPIPTHPGNFTIEIDLSEEGQHE